MGVLTFQKRKYVSMITIPQIFIIVTANSKFRTQLL